MTWRGYQHTVDELVYRHFGKVGFGTEPTCTCPRGPDFRDVRQAFCLRVFLHPLPMRA